MTKELYSWKMVSSLKNRDNEKTRGWLLPEKDFLKLKHKKFEQKVLTVEIDNQGKQEMVLSNYVPDSKDKILRRTKQIIYSIDDRSYKLTPVIYYEKEEQKLEYIPRSEEGIKPFYIKGAGVMKCGKVYIAFMYQNRVININEMNIFISL